MSVAGRVKTLHPAVHGGILAIRSKQDHMSAIEQQKITPIDLVSFSKMTRIHSNTGRFSLPHVRNSWMGATVFPSLQTKYAEKGPSLCLFKHISSVGKGFIHCTHSAGACLRFMLQNE